MRICGALALLLAAIFCLAEPVRPAPEAINVRVRLLDRKDGHPLKHRLVQLTTNSVDGNSEYLKGRTDNRGIVIFRLGVRPPTNLWVVPLDDFPCTTPEDFSTDVTLREGSQGNLSDIDFCNPHIATLAQPIPGEIVFYARRLNFWERYHIAIER
jgi:hypothetical protein